jgi:rhodanese-related sulfurtransferase
VRWIEVEELAPRLEAAKPTAVIDVRGPDEFAGPLGHIPNARNLPLADLPHHFDELSSLAAMPVVLVCKTDKRSASAAALLASIGLRDVIVLRGGLSPIESHLRHEETGTKSARSSKLRVRGKSRGRCHPGEGLTDAGLV